MNRYFSKKQNPRQLIQVIVWIPVILSILLYWYTTAQGVGLSPDSVTYIGVADSLIQGKGLVVPFGFPPFNHLTQFPPLYSILIATLSLLGPSLQVSARILNLIILIFFYLVANKLLRQIETNLLSVRFLILTLIGVSATFLTITSMVWSETLMITLGLFGFYLLLSNTERNNYLITIFTGFIFALAILTRYAAITYLGAAILYKLLLIKRNNLKQKLNQILLLSIPGFLLLSGWLFLNSYTAGTATNRSFNFHMLTYSHLQELMTTISGWFLIPNTAPTIIKLLLISILFLVFFILFARELNQVIKNSSSSLTFLLMLFIIVYAFFIILSEVFLDANIPLDFRILSPLFISLIFLILPLSRKLISLNGKSSFFKISIPAILLTMSILSISNNLEAIRFIHNNGTGFAQLYEKDSEIFTFLKQQPMSTIFVSNAPEPAYFFTNHPVYSLPKNYLQMSQTANPEYDTQMTMLKEQFTTADGMFIIFNGIPGSSNEEIENICQFFGLEKVNTYNEAIIFKSNPQATFSTCKN